LAESSIAYKKDGVAVRDASKTNDCKGVSYSATDDKSFRLPTSHEWELAARYKGNDNSNGAIQESGLIGRLVLTRVALLNMLIIRAAQTPIKILQ
jgi:hypothetical protein